MICEEIKETRTGRPVYNSIAKPVPVIVQLDKK